MAGFIVTLLVTALSFLILARISIGLEVENVGSALLAAFVIGLLNAILRPILDFFTFPITILTLGLFTFVIDAVVLYITAALVKGFEIRNFLAAIITSILLALLNGLIFWILPG